jgi:hypothetical protein
MICVTEIRVSDLDPDPHGSALFLEQCDWKAGSGLGSSDFGIILEIQYASCVFGLALKFWDLFIKKCFLKYWTVSILFDLFSFEKNSTVPYKSWKKISLKLAVQGIKRSGILRWFQKCAEVSSLAKGKNFSQTNIIFRDLKNLAKNCFSAKKSLGTSWHKSSTHFWNKRKIPLLLIPSTPNFEEFFFLLL